MSGCECVLMWEGVFLLKVEVWLYEGVACCFTCVVYGRVELHVYGCMAGIREGVSLAKATL